MTPKLVTFDCAETLVAVRWSVGQFAMDCAAHIGLETPPSAGETYASMYHARLPEFLRVNLTRDEGSGRAFWLRLGADWLEAIGSDPRLAESLQAAADELGFGPRSILFSLFDDVRPCIEKLSAMGCRLAVISNWDYSLRRTLQSVGVLDHFSPVIASLEEGFEKPDPRIFRLALDAHGVEPGEAIHVGDNPIDDLQGARGVGMRAVLIDRSRGESSAPYLKSLLELPEAFAWIA